MKSIRKIVIKLWVLWSSFIILSLNSELASLSTAVFPTFLITKLESIAEVNALDVKLKEGVIRSPSPPPNDVWENQNKGKLEKSSEENGTHGLEDETHKVKDKEVDENKIISNKDGPSLLTSFSNSPCLSTQAEDYIYEVCLYRNITQRRNDGYSDPILLGKWDSWSRYEMAKEGESLAEEDKAAQKFTLTDERTEQNVEYWMNYEDGLSCKGGNIRSAHLKLQCSESEFRIDDIEEPYPCEYHLKLSTPIPCHMFKESLSHLPVRKPRKRVQEERETATKSHSFERLSEEEIDLLDENTCKISLKACQEQQLYS